MGSPNTKEIVRIPEPKGLPLLGNVAEFRSSDSLQDLNRLHDTYGEIFRLKLPGGKAFVCAATNRLVNEVCDESRFKKSLKSEVGEARLVTNDGLFTAENEEENWAIAHRILMPAFGPVAIRGMFDEMHDITTQLALKWARHSSSQRIAISEDFTRLALDTIALCSMDFRFNSYYKEGVHPFVQSMADVLIEIGKRYQRPDWAKKFFRGSEQKLSNDTKVLRDTAAEIINSRRANPESTKKKDLLNAMMDGVDTKTGKKLTDECITDNLITFLVAGHETTSGTLSFAVYSLLKNPAAYQRAQKEVDEIMRRDPITIDKIYSLKYIPAVLRETLRQCAPIPAFNVEPLEDTTLAGKYPVKKGDPIVAYLTKAHRDPAVFGEDADEFRPERMMDENFNSLQKEFPNCWKPFGNGMRACIGRPFAWQEMLLAMSILLQNFDFHMDDPSYSLKIMETLTIKPKDFYVRASLRHGMTALDLEHQLRGGPKQGERSLQEQGPTSTPNTSGSSERPMSIFYGSNSGTCKALALRLAADAKSHGFNVAKVDVLDTARDSLPIGQPVVIITSSYEGHPPDNAAHFVAWLRNLTGQEAKDVPYALFGVGNREWSQTFHSIPKLIDRTLEERGAEQLAATGFTDVSENDPFGDFENWEDETLWPAMKERYARSKPDSELPDNRLSVQVTMPRSATLRQETREAIVTATRILTAPGTTPVKKHIEIRLATGTAYRAGDYLAILPLNPRHIVERVFRRFELAWDAALVIKGDKLLPLPIDQPTSAWDVFTSYVELGQPATKRNILALAQCAQDFNEQTRLEELSEDRSIMKKRISVLDLLDEFPSAKLPIAQFLSFLPPMRIRQYSISSSPLKDPTTVSLTYSLLDEPSLSGHGRHVGVAINYLSSLNPSDRLQVAVRASNLAFHLPSTPESTPIICIAAGAGLAPFRSFIQERAVQIAAGRLLAPAVLFYGCRGRSDDLYRLEFDGWEAEGAVLVKRAYSREIAKKETMGCTYVQHRMMLEKELLYDLWDQGAKLFVCGSREFGVAVEKTCVELIEKWKEPEEDARELLEGFRNERFVMDVFD